MERAEQPGSAAPDGAVSHDEPERLQGQPGGPAMTPTVLELADRAEISGLVSRFFSAIDDRRLDRATMEAVFTANACLTRPNGASVTGPEAIAVSQSESFARFRATHHVSSDHVIDVDGDSARIRANIIAMHLWADTERDPNTLQTHFLAAGVLHARAARTSQGWRISDASVRNTWRTGSGYSSHPPRSGES